MKKPVKENLTSLFKLVKNLSMSERIYFKKFIAVSAPNAEGKFLELFNILEGMSVFELHKIELAFDEKKGLDKAQAFFSFLSNDRLFDH